MIDELRRIIMANPALMAEFTAISGEAELFRKTIDLARAAGREIDEAELTETVRANRRAWLERRL